MRLSKRLPLIAALAAPVLIADAQSTDHLEARIDSLSARHQELVEQVAVVEQLLETARHSLAQALAQHNGVGVPGRLSSDGTIRSDPSPVGSPLAEVSTNAPVTVLDVNGNYVLVETSAGLRGWIHNQSLEENSVVDELIRRRIVVQQRQAEAVRLAQREPADNARLAQRQREDSIRAARQRRDAALRAKGIPLLVERFDFAVNSAGGVEPRFDFWNLSEKTIKYVNVTIRPFNAVGDPVRGEIDGEFEQHARLVGPIEPDRWSSYSYSSDPLFYQGTTACIELRTLIVEFVDGTTYLMRDDLAIASEDSVRLQGDCAYRTD